MKKMVIIQVQKKDKDRVLEVLLGNGKFRSLGDNRFDIIEHSNEVVEKLKEKGVVIELVNE